ncbi:unnamed protein product, partial [Brenthis ino]
MDFVKIPNSALAFYAKIYCKKKRISKAKSTRVLIEATKSWLSLNKAEKQKIVSKYQEYKNYYRKAFAEHLKKAEPYLKKKLNKEEFIRNNVQIDSNSTIHKDEIINLNTDQPQEFNYELSSENANNIVKSPLPLQNNTENVSLSSINGYGVDDMQHHVDQVLEPAPPKLMTGKELFDMINENHDNSWKNLTVKEKCRYSNAVLTIKKNYLKEYKNYLEQLSSEKLYHHYHKSIIKI